MTTNQTIKELYAYLRRVEMLEELLVYYEKVLVSAEAMAPCHACGADLWNDHKKDCPQVKCVQLVAQLCGRPPLPDPEPWKE